jgi:hypothetical protein
MRGATVRFRIAGKDRLGVVIEVRPDLVNIAYGTSEPHDDCRRSWFIPRQGKAERWCCVK